MLPLDPYIYGYTEIVKWKVRMLLHSMSLPPKTGMQDGGTARTSNTHTSLVLVASIVRCP